VTGAWRRGRWPMMAHTEVTWCRIQTPCITNGGNHNDTNPNGVLAPHKQALGDSWVDPTAPDAYSSLCGIYDHEWQKHGWCLGFEVGPNATDSARHYFEYTLQVAATVQARPGCDRDGGGDDG
jgi:ribonuclease I